MRALADEVAEMQAIKSDWDTYVASVPDVLRDGWTVETAQLLTMFAAGWRIGAARSAQKAPGAPKARVVRDDSPPTPNITPAELRAKREQAGLSLSQLAQALGVQKSYVWKIEQGARRISAELVERWLQTVGG